LSLEDPIKISPPPKKKIEQKERRTKTNQNEWITEIEITSEAKL
jgi:hypothetical protein